MYFAYSGHHHHLQSPSPSPPLPPPSTCSQGHRSSLIIQTLEGGSICLLCLSNLLSNPKSLSFHVSYALSQLSQALSQPHFWQTLLTYHSYFLISPLVQVLASFVDDSIAKQTIDLILEICGSGNDEVYGEFVSRVAERLSSGALAWSRCQVYTIHCLGVLLEFKKNDPCVYIKDKDALVSNLVTGLQLPSEDIRGEILFVLYKISILQYACKDGNGIDLLLTYCPKLLYLSLEALLKTQNDDVRLNCIAFLMVLAQKGYFSTTYLQNAMSKDSFEADNFMQMTEHPTDRPSLTILFAEAVKAPLLSSDMQVQISTLDLIFIYLSWEGGSPQESQLLVEENIADYVFEILRSSGCKDPLVNSCIQVLEFLSIAEQAFRQRLAIGFTTLVPVLRYVAELPYHPTRAQTLKLIKNCVLSCPGLVSSTHVEELGLILTGMLKKHIDEEMGMLTETLTVACSTLIALMKCPSSHGTSNFAASIQDASKHAILTCINLHCIHSSQLLPSLYLLKESYSYCSEGNTNTSSCDELRRCLLDVCTAHLLPWFLTAISEMNEEDVVLGVLETFHAVLSQSSDFQAKEFAESLASSFWFSLSFGCLGLFPGEKMKWRTYLMLSSIVDVCLGDDSGKPIRDAALHLPSDPIELLFLLGQRNSHNLELMSCQSAVILILYISSLYDDRLADEKLALASVEQYILLNDCVLLHGSVNSVPMDMLVNLYGLYRGLAKISYQIPYSPEAERILFHLLAEKDWDLLSMRIHLTSLKWLFQQEKICKSLSNQILKLCRCNSSTGNDIMVCGRNSQSIDVHVIAELVATGDNLGAMLYVRLLRELLEESSPEHDIIAVLDTIAIIIEIFPDASDHLCLNGICSAIQDLCHHSSYSCSSLVFKAVTQLLFCILLSVHSDSLTDDDAWLAITVKLMDYLIHKVTADGWTREGLKIISILCLIMHHSASQALLEASKTILLSIPLVSTFNKIIHEACSKGHALIDHDEGTKFGETLVFVLLLHFFSFKSVAAVLPDTLDWQNLLENGNEACLLSSISIHCQDLCRLMHFGTPLVKLVASYCLLELFIRISDQNKRDPKKLKCPLEYLWSVIAVLEGLVFFSDINVAMNSAVCITMVFGWEKLKTEAPKIGTNSWCRLIVEEMAMSLAVSSLASKSFMEHHKPAIHVAVSLLKLPNVPAWMNSVFDNYCIAGIIKNLSASNLSSEIVLLFRELLNCGYLNADHVAGLNRVFQACRKHVYANKIQQASIEEQIENDVASNPEDLGKVCESLINIMSLQSSLSTLESHRGSKKLLEEIDLFSKLLMEEDNG